MANTVITIGREFGSGGRELGRRLAEALNIEYYDQEIITQIAQHTSFSEQYINQILERRNHALFPITVASSFQTINSYALQQIQQVYQAQRDAVLELAEKSSCVIVGRCADFILREQQPFRIFVYADEKSRLARCRSREAGNISDKELLSKMNDIDKGRSRYYEFYTGQSWGDKLNYDLCLNTSNVVIKEIVPMVAAMVSLK